MCTRKTGESLISFAWRQAVEQPRTVLAVIGFVAAAGMYYDMRGMMSNQTQASISLAIELRELNLRIERLEETPYVKNKGI